MSETSVEERRLTDLEALVSEEETEITETRIFMGTGFVKITDKGETFELSLRFPPDDLPYKNPKLLT